MCIQWVLLTVLLEKTQLMAVWIIQDSRCNLTHMILILVFTQCEESHNECLSQCDDKDVVVLLAAAL